MGDTATATIERKGGSAAPIPGLEMKQAAVADLAPDSGVLSVDEETGLVTAIVSVTGIVDNVDDRILPGAYEKTLKARRPKGVWSHDWKDWVSRTESIEEYLPGDSRLPKQTKDGKPWPKEAGALVVTTRFDVKRARSLDALQAVRFFSETGECEWSIGYVVPPGQATKDRHGVRNIKSLDLFEYGPVLFGAASESMTLSVKSLADGRPGAAEHAAHLRDLGGDLSALGETKALSDGSFPISTKGDLVAALAAYPRAGNRAEAKAHIIGRALRLGFEASLPRGWVESKADDDVDDDDVLTAEEEAAALAQQDEVTPEPAEETKGLRVERKYDTSPVGSPGDRENWVDQVGGRPRFIRAIAHALIREGRSEQTAIQIAVGTVRRWAAGGGDVTEKTKAKAAKALAEWEAKKARARATPNKKALGSRYVVEGVSDRYDPRIEQKTAEPALQDVPLVESKMYGSPHLPGSYEHRQQAAREAATVLLRGPEVSNENGYSRYEWSDVSITATFDDRVIATRYKWDGPGPTTTESFEIDYEIDDATGLARMGQPKPVTLRTVTVVEDGTEEITPVDGFSGLPDMTESVTSGVKAMLAAKKVETKAGRVLSKANEARLRSAAEHLFAVLRAAGITVDPEASPNHSVEADPETTAPSATAAAATGGTAPSAKTGEPEGMEGKVLLNPADYARGLRVRAGLLDD